MGGDSGPQSRSGISTSNWFRLLTPVDGPTLCHFTGRSSAWLERLLGVQEVGSSNLLGPTT